MSQSEHKRAPCCQIEPHVGRAPESKSELPRRLEEQMNAIVTNLIGSAGFALLFIGFGLVKGGARLP